MSNMRTIRKKIGLSQSDLADAVGVTQGAIAHYEVGRRKPGLDECRKIIDALNKHGAEATLDEVFPPEPAQMAS